VLYYPVFYAITGVVQGLTGEETLARAKDTFVPLMKRNLLFWIPVQFGTFSYVEENLQIPVLIVCGLVWTVILSVSAGRVTHDASPTSDTKKDDGDGAYPSGAEVAADSSVLVGGASVEANMRELASAESSLAMNGTTTFFFAANFTSYDYDVEEAGSVRTNPSFDDDLAEPTQMLDEQFVRKQRLGKTR
jgi:Mpv17 / PMP22 family